MTHSPPEQHQVERAGTQHDRRPHDADVEWRELVFVPQLTTRFGPTPQDEEEADGDNSGEGGPTGATVAPENHVARASV
jgi:hypothetical protein